jgi:16S rRNA (cytosine1402-N4)-methyltransferase
MLQEVLDVISPQDTGCYVDGTFGGGGYTRALLDSSQCRVFAFDRDPSALTADPSLAQRYQDRLVLEQECFSQMDVVLAHHGVSEVDGVTLDIGVSSLQLDTAERGFSFAHDGPLDMRMSQSGITAADLINSASEDKLTAIIKSYGEERRARRIAKAIVETRESTPIKRTVELADIIERVIGARGGARIHPATRTFQAIRIYLNNELEELARGLSAAERLLKPAGRLVVVAFHSLEDRIVKRFLAERFGKASAISRHRPEIKRVAPSFRSLFTKAKTPGADELKANPRSRSARLRAGERTEAAPWPLNFDRLGVVRGI